VNERVEFLLERDDAGLIRAYSSDGAPLGPTTTAEEGLAAAGLWEGAPSARWRIVATREDGLATAHGAQSALADPEVKAAHDDLTTELDKEGGLPA
jgi:hypothetical protein